MNSNTRKTWYIDFDRTLFDTDGFETALAQSMDSLIDEAEFRRTYKEVLKSFDEGYNYTIERHAQILENIHGIPRDITISNLSSIFHEAGEFMFPDSYSFLDSVHHDHLILLSFGNKSTQEMKIKASNLEKYFKTILITSEHKHTITLPTEISESTIFLNDNRIENKQLRLLYPQAQFIEIQRISKDIPKEGFEIITSLTQI